MRRDDLLRRHAEEVTFLLELRRHLLHRPLGDVAAFERLESRILGHLEGLGTDPASARPWLELEARRHPDAYRVLDWLKFTSDGWLGGPFGHEPSDSIPDSPDPEWDLAAVVPRAAVLAAEGSLEDLVRAVRACPDDLAVTLAAGASGYPTFGDWLVEQCARPALARVAGAAFSLLTGVDLVGAGLATGLGEGRADWRSLDAQLPVPDPARLRTWWGDHAERWEEADEPVLLGYPMDPDWAFAVLRVGPLSARLRAWAWLTSCGARPPHPTRPLHLQRAAWAVAPEAPIPTRQRGAIQAVAAME